MLVRLVECTDYDENYGILDIGDYSKKEIQNLIYDIKNEFDETGFDDWSIGDVFDEIEKRGYNIGLIDTDVDDVIEI